VVNPTVTSISANAGQTYTATQVAGGYITRGNTGNQNDQLPTGAQLGALPGITVGSNFDLVVNSSSTGDVTLLGGSGVNIIGGPTISAGEAGVVKFICTATNTFQAVFLT
jgi:hypothetical protein